MTERFSKIAMGLLLIWVPLAFYYRAAEGFTLPKEWIGLLALGFLAGIFLFSGDPKIWRFSLIQAAGLFTVWMILDSFIVGSVKLEALKGSVHVLLMMGTLGAVVFLCRRGLRYERLLHYALFAGFLMALYGIFQSLGGDSTQWTTRFSSRAFSTLGNPDYLGGHLAALAPLAFVLGLRSEGRLAWQIYRLLTLVLLACLWLTRVRGAEIAVLASFVFIVFTFWRPWGKDLFSRNKRPLLGLLGIFIVVVSLGVIWKGGSFSWAQSKVSIEQREGIYKTAWEIVKDHPILGVGLGQLGVVYPLYQYKPYAPEDYPKHPYVYSEHVHNEFLQFWVEGGVIGLMLFLVVLGTFALALRKSLSSPELSPKDRELLLAVSAAFIALLVQALSNFPFQVAPTAVLFGLLLAAPLALGPASALPALRFSRPQGWVLVLVLLAGAAFGIRAMAGSIAYRDTAGETSLGNNQKAAGYADRLVKLSPLDYKAWNIAGQAYAQAGRMDEAFAAYQQSLNLDSNDVENLMAMADLKAKAGQLPEALSLSQKALSLTPNFVGPLWVEAYCQYQLKQYAPAADSFRVFLTFAPQSPDAWVGLGVCEIHLGKKSEAIDAWQKAHQLAPDNAEVIQFLKGAGVKPS
jgi:O-antigen ligase